jgi:hypothetical protein
MQVHWPELAKHTINEAHRLGHQLGRGWHAPMLDGASASRRRPGSSTRQPSQHSSTSTPQSV